MARLLWYVTTDGVELWLPTLAEEQAVYQAAEDAKPKMPRVVRPTMESPRSPRSETTSRRGGGPDAATRVILPAE